MYFFPRNGATLNDSFCFFMYQGISFPRSGKVSSDLCYFHKVKINRKKTGNCGKLFSIKLEIIVIFNFHKTENVTPVSFIFTKWKGI